MVEYEEYQAEKSRGANPVGQSESICSCRHIQGRLGLWAAESPVNPYEFRRSQRMIGSDIIAVTIIDGKRVMVDPQTLKPLDAVPIAHPEPKD